MELHILGIRHHGVGSAINTLQRLEELQPDCIIVEGPVELMDQLNKVPLSTFTPPVSILVYNPDNIQQSSFYPFAEFSPEWVAIDYAQKNNISFTTADLPTKHAFGIKEAIFNEAEKAQENASELPEDDNTEENSLEKSEDAPLPIHNRPIEEIAKAAGFSDADLWWEHHFEQKYLTNAAAHFQSVLEVMQALRDTYVNADYKENERREAFMREAIRKAEKEGKQNIVFICGAWHAPALLLCKEKKKTDTPLLKKLPKTKVASAWIPWMNSRLAWVSGYGAGLESPGWYEHLWKFPQDDGKRWILKTAKIFRAKKMDISTAHIIETYRLAIALAAMRSLARPGLKEMYDATVSVMCLGDEILMKLVQENLITGKKIGRIPDGLPKLPIQTDFDAKIKTYRFQIREDEKIYNLDLREARGLEKSIFLHRLAALNIKWGVIKQVRSKGTFKETWALNWSPEILLDIIDKAIWGNSIEIAAQNYLQHLAKETTHVQEITKLIDQAILGQLFATVDFLIKRIDALISVSYDVPILFETVVPLINIYRYSDIRKTDETVLLTLIEGLLLKININLETACYGLNEESSNTLFNHISSLNTHISLIDNQHLEDDWYAAIASVVDKDQVSYIIQGAANRILFDQQLLDIESVSNAMSRALSVGKEPIQSTYWIEGFLKGSALILVIDHVIWNMLYTWITSLDNDKFNELIPILRRTFSRYGPEERKQIGQKAKKGLDLQESGLNITEDAVNFNFEEAQKAVENRAILLGLTLQNN